MDGSVPVSIELLQLRNRLFPQEGKMLRFSKEIGLVRGDIVNQFDKFLMFAGRRLNIIQIFGKV